MLDSINYRRISRLLKGFYHRKGTGRKPYNPLSMLKAQLLKHLFRIPSDLRLALRLKYDWQAARACRFRKRNPSHGLFTQFRHRLGEETYLKIFNHLLRQLLESGVIIGRVIAVDSTHVKAYSQRSRDNKIGRSDPDARVGRGKRGFILGYWVQTACCARSEMPLAFAVAPCNENDKTYFKPLLSTWGFSPSSKFLLTLLRFETLFLGIGYIPQLLHSLSSSYSWMGYFLPHLSQT